MHWFYHNDHKNWTWEDTVTGRLTLKSMSNSITCIKSQVHITNRHMKQKEIKICHLLFLWSISIFTVLWSPFIGSLIITPNEQSTALWAEHQFILQALYIYVPMGHTIFHMLTAASRESFCRDLHLESCLPWTSAVRGKKRGKQCGSRTGPHPTPCFGLFLSPIPQKHHFIEVSLPSLACTVLVQEAGLGGNITQVPFLLSAPPDLSHSWGKTHGSFSSQFQAHPHLPKKLCGRGGHGCWRNVAQSGCSTPSHLVPKGTGHPFEQHQLPRGFHSRPDP